MKSLSAIKIIFFSLALLLGAANLTYASETDGTIVAGGNAGYAWSDRAGWVNFGATNGNIHITDSGMSGYAWNTNYGWINMLPTSTSTDVGVKVSTAGTLSGYAWGSSLGWINFSGVSINSSGKFIGQATGSIVGTLTFDCVNCDVRTDFRPANFRTTSSPTPSVTVSGGGGGGGGGGGVSYVSGPGGQAVPAHMSAYNVPMRLFPAQSGTLTQNLTGGKAVKVEVPANIVATDELTIIVSEQPVSVDISVSTVAVLGDALFDITARDSAGNLIHNFLKPIQITLIVPENLEGRSDLGVYYFDESQGLWIKISDAVFSSSSVSFFVDHLTLFGIFSATDLPSFLQPFFPVPVPTPTSTGEASSAPLPQPATEIAPAPPASGSEENPPLFDIEVKPGTLESQSKTKLVIIITLVIAGIAALIYIFLKRRRNAQTNR
ncbi:MAG: Uncharacterized protein G01um101429_996 [Parcubacteria group bacterium Gr01-1014_29]|nr:MAG: Uncharacterized protein G01um101429_996 [Parcubacteria group bacterium Gr01-1014_29]